MPRVFLARQRNAGRGVGVKPPRAATQRRSLTARTMQQTETNSMHELILGGAKSGKSGCAEDRAAAWLAAQPGREAWLIATALPGDDEMHARIERHRADRARRVPGLHTLEEPLQLGRAIASHSRPERLLLVDCLTLWLT